MAAPPTTVPCEPWTTDEEVRRCCVGLDPAYDLTFAINFASEILFRLSGRQYPGQCERTVQPCLANNCGCDGAGFNGFVVDDWWWALHQYPTWPVQYQGGFANIGACCGSCCIPTVALPISVNEIIEIVIDGVVLDPSAYKIQAYRRVARVDGEGWPCSNDLTIDASPYVGPPDGSKDGSWQITYGVGKPVPEGGRYAASIFACQIAKNQCGSDDCVLPQRLKSITRQDVEMAFADPLEFLDNGMTGIYEVDLWLQSVNPNGLRRRSRVYRADQKKTNTTWTG